MPAKASHLPEALKLGLQQADLILHAGDWTSLDVVDQLLNYAPVYGVAGNNDGAELAKRWGYSRIVECEGKRIGLVHGHGRSGTTERRAMDAFTGQMVDAIVFGHSHVPLCKKQNGILMFNPGSPTDKRRQPTYSYGVLELSKGSLQGRIVYFDNKR